MGADAGAVGVRAAPIATENAISNFRSSMTSCTLSALLISHNSIFERSWSSCLMRANNLNVASIYPSLTPRAILSEARLFFSAKVCEEQSLSQNEIARGVTLGYIW